jgi:hypothetical protein
MTHARHAASVMGAWILLASLPADQTRPERMKPDELFDAYRIQGPRVVADAIGAMSNQFDRFRSDFEARVLPAWRSGSDRHLHATFMLEIAIATAGESHRYPEWDRFITSAGTLLSDRPERPGTDAAADAFEILWHQAAVAFLDGLQNPALRDRVGVQPMAGRFAAVPARAGASAVLVSPWAELARGVSVELFSIDHPEALDVLGPSAVEHYRLAISGGGSARAEAELRSAHVLTRLGRPVESLGILAELDDTRASDVTYRYWRELLRGQALDALGRLEDAVHAYEDALRIVPSAQTPHVAIAVIRSKQHRSADAAVQLEALHRNEDTSADLWSTYRDGDARFLGQRLTALREASRR